jgi:hypothetical protein
LPVSGEEAAKTVKLWARRVWTLELSLVCPIYFLFDHRTAHLLLPGLTSDWNTNTRYWS